MNEKEKLNLRDVDISFKEKFVAHPVRFLLTIPLYVVVLRLILLLLENFNINNLIVFVISCAVLTFFEWIIYGPINMSRLKKEKQMEIMAEYIAEKGDTSNINKEETKNQYCHQCGKKIEEDWNICPYCNTKVL